MNADQLIELGSAQRDGELLAPGGSNVCFTPLNGRCYRLRIELPSGGAVSAVIAGLAIKVEAPPPDPPPNETDTS